MSKTLTYDIKFAKRFPANLITNVVAIILSVLVGVLIVPYFIDTLGKAAYGIIPLATSVTAYITLIASSITTSTSRYLMFALSKSDIKEAQKTFSAALVVITILIMVLIPIGLIIAIFSPAIFNIGDIASEAVVILFGFIFASALIHIFTASITSILFSYNRIYLKNIVTITQTFVQIGLILLLFVLITPSLPLIGIAYFIAAVIALLLAVIFVKIFCKDIKFSMHCASKEKFKELLSMSIWTLIKSLGLMLRSNCGIIVANIICGVLAGADFAIILTWQTLIYAISGGIADLFNPMIYGCCSRKERENLSSVVSASIRFVGIISALLIAILTIYSQEIMTLWVGVENAHLGLYAVLLILPVLFSATAMIPNNVMIANLRFRYIAIIYVTSGILSVLFSVIGAYNFGTIGIIIGNGIAMILCESLWIYLSASKLMHETLLRHLIPSILMLVMTLFVGFLVKLLFNGDNWWSLVIGCLLIAILSLILYLRIFMKKQERKMIRECLPKRVEKKIPKWIL